MVTIRSLAGMKLDSTLRKVVLPVPVPPDTRMLSRPFTVAANRASAGCDSEPRVTRSSAVMVSAANLRMVSTGPSTASGGMTALTREPSARRASTMGDDSSIRRPMEAAIRTMICLR